MLNSSISTWAESQYADVLETTTSPVKTPKSILGLLLMFGMKSENG
jgi:hypothetical protein